MKAPRALSALAGGILDAGSDDESLADLRQLVHDIGNRNFLARIGSRHLPELFDAQLWRNIEETGLSRLTTTPELYAGPVEAAVLLSGMARHAAAAPIAETDLLASWLAGKAGLHPPDNGPLTLAITDADVSGGRLCGTAAAVPWATAAEAVVLAVRSTEGLHVSVISPPTSASGHNIAGEPRQCVPFDVAVSDTELLDAGVADELVRRGAWARCVQVIGALDAAAASTVAHTRDRIQFGRALSRFQSVQHSLAAIAGDIERARATVALAVAAAEEYGFDDLHTDYAVTLAKVTLGSTVHSVTTAAHQLHGAVGVTLEHRLRLATMRATCWIDEFGSTDHHRRRLGRAATNSRGHQNASTIWDLVVGTDLAGWVTADAH